jgi:hypothetical protein
MAITRDFANNGQFNVVDWTQEVNTIPNQWGTIGQLGIFSQESVAEHVVTFEEIIKDGAILVDRVRGDRSSLNQGSQRKLHAFQVPHFPLEDAIYPQDIQGKRAYGSPDAAETFDAVRARKMQRVRQNHAWTLEFARAYALTTGLVYAPNGTVSQDWYQEMTGAARPAAIDFLLGTGTTDILAKIEQAIAQMQDASGAVTYTGIVALCSTEFFSKLISHATIKQAYQYYTSTQEPLRQRLAAGGSITSMHREFFHGGIRFIELRDSYAGQRLIPANEAYFVPTGTDYFKTYFSPANRFGLVNTLGEEVYYFENMNANGTAYTIETESNFVNALLKPLMVIKATTSN